MVSPLTGSLPMIGLPSIVMSHTPPQVAGNGEPDLAGLDEALRRVDAGNGAVRNPDADDFALLDDVDAMGIRSTGVTPGDGVVASGPAARLQQPAMDRKPRIRRAVE